jgi:hypothetical protein
MTIQHKNIIEADLHEPKGVSLANSKTVYVADGAGSGAWVKPSPQSLSGISTNGVDGQLVGVNGAGNFVLVTAPHGHISFFNSSTPSTITYPSTATKIAPTTTGSGYSTLISEGSTARLTYTGIDDITLNITYLVSLDQSTGSDRDIVVSLYKNGSLLDAQSISTTQSGKKISLSGTTNDLASEDDYYELYVTNLGASGNVNVYALQLTAIIAGA